METAVTIITSFFCTIITMFVLNRIRKKKKVKFILSGDEITYVGKEPITVSISAKLTTNIKGK